jgi:hypothetical protein
LDDHRRITQIHPESTVSRNQHFWDGRSAAFGSSAVVPLCFAERLPMPRTCPSRHA